MPDLNTFIRRSMIALLGLLIVFGIIQLAISAWLVSQFDKKHNYRNLGERDRTRFTLFACVWTIGIGAPYMLLLAMNIGGVFISALSFLIFTLLTWLFWLISAAAVTDMLGGRLNCATQTVYVYCGQLNALEAFSWILWIFSTIALFIVAWRVVSSVRRGEGFTGGLVARSY